MCYECEIGPDEDGVTFRRCPVYSNALIWRLLKMGGRSVGCGRADLGGLRRSVKRNVYFGGNFASLCSIWNFLITKIAHLARKVSECGPALEQMSYQ